MRYIDLTPDLRDALCGWKVCTGGGSGRTIGLLLCKHLTLWLVKISCNYRTKIGKKVYQVRGGSPHSYSLYRDIVLGFFLFLLVSGPTQLRCCHSCQLGELGMSVMNSSRFPLCYNGC
jgi:hypothetical protein